MRHLVPQFYKPLEFPPERVEWESRWMMCDHEFITWHSSDYFIRGIEVCRHCRMLRCFASGSPDICTHVVVTVDRFILPTGEAVITFSLLSHPELGA